MTNTQRSLRRYYIYGIITLILLVGGVGGWAFMAQLAGAVIAQSNVVVESDSKQVQHLEGGIVTKLLVRNGTSVKAGQILVMLDDIDTKANLEIINSQLYELLARKARLEAERDLAEYINFPKQLTDLKDIDWIARTITGQRNLFISRRNLLKGQEEQLFNQSIQMQEEIVGLNAQLSSQNTQADFVKEELKGLIKLQKENLVEVSRVMILKRESSKIDGQKGQLIANIAQVKTKIGENKLSLLQIKQDAATKVLEELREIQPKIAELSERRLSAVAKLKRINIVAPRAGFVHELQLSGDGGVIGPGQVIMLIVPEKDSLVLSAQVTPQDIDQVVIGQKVVITFSAFSAAKTPNVEGEVYHIAADLTQDNPNLPPYFEVRIRLLEGELKKLSDQKLRPGMPAEAYIQTTTRSVLSYILKPITDQIDRAMRES